MDAKTEPVASAPLSHAETRLVVWGTLLPIFIGSLDGTILASALPTIGRAFGDVHNLPWLITAYLIATTAATPLYGKVSDIYGRRVTLLVALAIHISGSLICALAPNMGTLIFGRAVEGIGGAGLSSMGMVILGDIAAPKDRGRYYGYFSATYTTAGASGPLLGGFIAEYLHWSVIFWLNLPLELIAVGLGLTLLRKLPRNERPHRLDILGAVLIMTASSAFMLALNLGGVRFPWLSAPVLGLFGFALALGFGFVLRLLSAPEPLIPLSILRDRVVRCAVLANTSGWGSMVGLNIFLPMYLQTVLGLSASAAGLCLMVLMSVMNLSAGVIGQLLGRTRRYKAIPMAVLTIAIAAVLTLAVNAANLTTGSFLLLIVLIGIGFGPVPPLTAVVLQNAVSAHQFGVAIGTMNFSRNLFAAMLVALFGAIILASIPVGEAGQLAPGGLAQAGEAAVGFARVFYAAAASLTVTLLALVLLPERPLRTGTPD